MPNCAAPGCLNRSYKKSIHQLEIEKTSKITFHRFPKVKDQRIKWIECMELQSRSVPENSYLCSVHFAKESFDRTSLSCIRLRKDAVPLKIVTNTTKPDNLNQPEHNDLPQVQQEVRPSTSRATDEETDSNTTADSLIPGGTPKRIRECDVISDCQPLKRRCTRSIFHEQNVERTQAESESSSKNTSDMPLSKLPLPIHRQHDEASIDSPVADTPRKIFLRKALKNQQEVSRRQILALKKRIKRQEKRIAVLKSILNELKTKELLAEEQLDLLKSIGTSNAHLLKRFVEKASNKKCLRKKHGRAISREFSPELRTFAVTLQYYSPRAYNYVRKHFDSCLPHPKTISNWYRSINGDPGFIDEAFACIVERVKVAAYQLIGTLVFDEMSIRQHVEYDGKKYSGYVDFGVNVVNDHSTIAKDALVFLFVCMNSSWKVPIGYFLTNGVSADQKCNLILQSMTLLHDAGVRVAALTFDGAPANLSVAKKLECNLNPDSLQTYFLHPETHEKVFIFPDSCHMIKLVRNIFGGIKILIDGNEQRILWKIIEDLHELQSNEGMHLANKLRSAHIHFDKQKMKVRFATQLCSTSVTQSLKVCREDLHLPQFRDSSATETFLQVFNDLFDIFNSKNIRQVNFKKPINANNWEQVFQRMDECKAYILGLKLCDGQRVVDSTKKTGFFGFLICINSLKGLYQDLCQTTELLTYIPTYKISQDHVELFFGCIRSQGGHNNNPTARQFKAALKKLLIHSEVRDIDSGNCIPLENITILHVSSARSSEDVINMSTPYTRTSDQEIPHLPDSNDVLNTVQDHSYIQDIRTLTQFSFRVIAYIAGFVVKNLKKTLQCEECIDALTGYDNSVESNLIKVKSRGGLQFPSTDVIRICKEAEKILRFALKESGGTYMNNKFTEQYLISRALSQFTGSDALFQNLRQHVHDQNFLENHDVHLTRAILSKYIKIRLFYIGKQAVNNSKSERHKFNKLTLFRGE